MNVKVNVRPRFFVGPKSFPNGWPVYPVYDRSRLGLGGESLPFAWVPVIKDKYDADAKQDAESIAAAMNVAHSEARR